MVLSYSQLLDMDEKACKEEIDTDKHSSLFQLFVIDK